ncbi:uncharacterized protein LOC131590308 isoform X2 [Poecile atricapillus]|uniref:uncharacterized protein LOC131590308 isoform X2 n=1 Tax=Poecile atricapillus TaxID=48891 RepID=UPI002739D748|nr:uncharacterized protein LOC131590308 isoform X2 [Poecile atricapillus]
MDEGEGGAAASKGKSRIPVGLLDWDASGIDPGDSGLSQILGIWVLQILGIWVIPNPGNLGYPKSRESGGGSRGMGMRIIPNPGIWVIPNPGIWVLQIPGIWRAGIQRGGKEDPPKSRDLGYPKSWESGGGSRGMGVRIIPKIQGSGLSQILGIWVIPNPGIWVIPNPGNLGYPKSRESGGLGSRGMGMRIIPNPGIWVIPNPGNLEGDPEGWERGSSQIPGSGLSQILGIWVIPNPGNLGYPKSRESGEGSRGMGERILPNPGIWVLQIPGIWRGIQRDGSEDPPKSMRSRSSQILGMGIIPDLRNPVRSCWERRLWNSGGEEKPLGDGWGSQISGIWEEGGEGKRREKGKVGRGKSGKRKDRNKGRTEVREDS